jgi:hypothetical protein
MELPTHPEADDAPDATDRGTMASWGARILVGAVIAVVVVVIVLHLAGVVGPGAN